MPYVNNLIDRFIADCKSSGGVISDVETRAMSRLVADLYQQNIWSKLRYVNLFVGEGNTWRKNLLPFGTSVTDFGSPVVTFNSKIGLSTSGAANAGLRTGFIPSQSGLTATGNFRAAYGLKPVTTGVVFGGGDTPGVSYIGGYLGFCNSAPGFSKLAGTVTAFNRDALGLQSINLTQAEAVSRWRYRLTQSAPNAALVAEDNNQNSLLLTHFNGATNYMCDGRLGAAIEGQSLTPMQIARLSSGLDRFHFEIGRKAALSGVFLGDSITTGTGVSATNNRWSTQVAMSLGIAEINKGVSGSCAQSGSGDVSAIPAIARYQNDVINQGASFVFILLGVNDVFRGADYTVAGYKRSLEKMIDDMVMAGISPRNIFLGTLPFTSDAFYAANQIGSRQKATEYFVAAIEVSSSRNVVLVDVYTAMQANGGAALLADGLHPNDAGAQVVSQAFVQAFETELYSW